MNRFLQKITISARHKYHKTCCESSKTFEYHLSEERIQYRWRNNNNNNKIRNYEAQEKSMREQEILRKKKTESKHKQASKRTQNVTDVFFCTYSAVLREPKSYLRVWNRLFGETLCNNSMWRENRKFLIHIFCVDVHFYVATRWWLKLAGKRQPKAN